MLLVSWVWSCQIQLYFVLRFSKPNEIILWNMQVTHLLSVYTLWKTVVNCHQYCCGHTFIDLKTKNQALHVCQPLISYLMIDMVVEALAHVPLGVLNLKSSLGNLIDWVRGQYMYMYNTIMLAQGCRKEEPIRMCQFTLRICTSSCNYWYMYICMY